MSNKIEIISPRSLDHSNFPACSLGAGLRAVDGFTKVGFHASFAEQNKKNQVTKWQDGLPRLDLLILDQAPLLGCHPHRRLRPPKFAPTHGAFGGESFWRFLCKCDVDGLCLSDHFKLLCLALYYIDCIKGCKGCNNFRDLLWLSSWSMIGGRLVLGFPPFWWDVLI